MTYMDPSNSGILYLNYMQSTRQQRDRFCYNAIRSSVVCNSTGWVSADQTKSFAKALHYSLFMHLGLRLLMFSRQCINFHLDPRWAKLVILLTFLSQTPHSHGSICGGQTYKSDHQLQLVLQKIKEEKVSETITKPSWCFIDYLNGKVHNL